MSSLLGSALSIWSRDDGEPVSSWCVRCSVAAFLKEMGAGRIVTLRPTGQPNRELAILAHLAVYADAAAVLLGDDVVAHRQPETSALTWRLGGEERLEQSILDVRRDPNAVVTHSDLHGVA